MSRFASSLAALETDGAMIEYRKEAVRNPDGLDPAEWIAALHEEHFRVLAELKAAREMTEGERVAKMRADLHLVRSSATNALAQHGETLSHLREVFGPIPAVQELTRVSGDMVDALQRLDKITREN